jgi:hypothetical protein
MKDPRSIDKNFVGSQEFFIKTQLMKQWIMDKNWVVDYIKLESVLSNPDQPKDINNKPQQTQNQHSLAPTQAQNDPSPSQPSSSDQPSPSSTPNPDNTHQPQPQPTPADPSSDEWSMRA